MKKYIKENIKPIIVIIITFAIQMTVYSGSQLINRNLKAYDFTIHVIDDKIPLIPIFILIYASCYIWWYLGPLVIVKKSKEIFYNFIVACLIGYIVHLAFYIMLPTVITRPIIEDKDIFSKLVNFIYKSDGGEIGINLFPSMHCFISTVMICALIDSTNVSKKYRIFSYCYGTLVCLSTVFVKQHYVIDIVGGVIIAIACYIIVKKLNTGLKLRRLINDN